VTTPRNPPRRERARPSPYPRDRARHPAGPRTERSPLMRTIAIQADGPDGNDAVMEAALLFI
jgi:hypothetical protein